METNLILALFDLRKIRLKQRSFNYQALFKEGAHTSELDSRDQRT